MKKLFTLFTILCMTTSMWADDSGSCGANLTWYYNSTTRTLTITGTGAMNNYSYYNFPWSSYNNSIQTVVLPEGLTSISDYAFYNSSISNINFPSTLKTIGSFAFQSCNSITSIVLPEGLTTLGGWALANMSKLEYVYLPSTLTGLDYYMLQSCTKLKDLVVGWPNPASITVKSNPFHGISNVSNIRLHVPIGTVSLYAATSPWSECTIVEKTPFAGSGTEADPYLIPSKALWDSLANMVSHGYTFSGKYFRQTADISVTTMVGTSSYPFRGTYDGYGHTLTVSYNTTADYTAPFRYIYGATFKNLRTAGTISVTAKFAGGFAGNANGANTFYNCRSSVTISSNRNGDGSNGGFIGWFHVPSANTLTSFEGCVFDGRFVSSNTSRWGGYIGWSESNGKLSLINCLFAPTELAMQTTNNLTITRTGDTLGIFTNLTNTYYTELLTNKQAKKACSITGASGVTVANAGAATTYNVSGITGYSTGLLYGGVLYGGQGEAISLNLNGSTNGYYAASTGTLTGTANPYSLTMTEANSVISTAVASVTSSANVTTYYGTLAAAVAAWENNSTLTLLADVTTTSTITRSSGTYTLDLNGFGIKSNGARVIRVDAGGNLTIKDSNTGNLTHRFSVNYPNSNTVNAGLATLNETSGTLVIEGGYITGGNMSGGNAYDRGGTGILVYGGSLTLQGGTVIGNHSNNGWGGGIMVTNGGTFTMSGGAICYNRADWGSGLSMYGNNDIGASNKNGTNCTITGGSIHHNYANGGDAVHNVANNYTVTFTMTGGSIRDNYAHGSGYNRAGLLVDEAKFTCNISGNPVITNNYSGNNVRNMSCFNAHRINITGTLSGANIGVWMNQAGVFTTNMGGHGEISQFVSNKPGYVVGRNAAGEAYLHAPYTLTYDGNGVTENVPSDNNAYAGGMEIAIPSAGLIRTGYTFDGWLNSVDGLIYAPGESFAISANTTLTAQWTINQYTITFNSNGGSAVAAITQDYASAITAPANPTREGYTFAGWDAVVPTTMPAEDMTINASWTPIQYTITFNTDGGSSVASITQDYGTSVTVPADPTKDNCIFLGWDQAVPGTMPLEGLTLTAQWLEPIFHGDVPEAQSATIAAFAATGESYDATIIRPIYREGTYNTFCVPFDLDADQIANSELNGALIKQFTGAHIEEGVLRIEIKDATTIQAGYPYLVKYETNQDLLSEMHFNGVTMDASAPVEVELDDVFYQGVYDPFTPGIESADDFHYLFVGVGNTIFWSNTNNALKPFRGYFTVKSTSAPGGAPVRRGMPVMFDEGRNNMPTDVEQITNDQSPMTVKVLKDGILYIIRDERMYNAQGQLVE